jgi:glycosyltransferase involved in cell wall biosynthesis
VLRRIGLQKDSEADAAEPTDEMVSVIAFSDGNEQDIREFLATAATQNYPNYEIIIVIDGDMTQAQTLSDTFAKTYSNLYFSFVPNESHNLSRRKLAYTIGFKAAKADIVLTTMTNCRIPDDNWLSSIMSKFNDSTDIVLGYAHFDFKEMRGGKRWYRQFDSLLTSALWLYYALKGKPYRGDGANLAYRKSLFFDNKGYGDSYFLHNGDDDIFVSKIADSTNTAVSLQSPLTVKWGSASKRMWVDQKEHYKFTSKYLPQSPFRRNTLFNIGEWLCLLASVAAILLGLPSVIPAAVSALFLLTLWGVKITYYRKAASVLGAIRLWWSLPLFFLIRPIADLLFGIRYKSMRVKNYTWQRHH